MIDPTILGILLIEACLRHENRPERVPIEHVWECLIEELERAGRQVLKESTIGGHIDPRLLMDNLQKQRDRAQEVQQEVWRDGERRRLAELQSDVLQQHMVGLWRSSAVGGKQP